MIACLVLVKATGVVVEGETSYSGEQALTGAKHDHSIP